MDLMFGGGGIGGDAQSQHPSIGGQNQQSRMGGRIGARMGGLDGNNDGRPRNISDEDDP